MDNVQQGQAKRVRGAFIFLSKFIDDGEISRAYKFFDNVIETEIQMAREDERKKLNTTTAAPGSVEVIPERNPPASAQ